MIRMCIYAFVFKMAAGFSMYVAMFPARLNAVCVRACGVCVCAARVCVWHLFVQSRFVFRL